MSRLFVLIILLGLVPASALAEDPPVFLAVINGEGTAVDPVRAADVATAPWGDVYVVDPNDNQVIRFANDGSLIAYWGTTGAAPGQLDNPQGIAVDDQGRVYVADTDNNRVQVFDWVGNLLDGWGVDTPRGITVGSGSYEYVYVTSIFIGSGDEYVFYYSLAGVQQGYWGGSSGSSPGQFDEVQDVEIDAWGRVYVADMDNSRIQYFNHTGSYLGEFGYNTGYYEIDRPRALGIDTGRNVFVHDESNETLLKYSPNLDLLSVLDMDERGTGLDVMGAGSIYVCSADWRDVLQYGYPPVITAAGSVSSGRPRFSTR